MNTKLKIFLLSILITVAVLGVLLKVHPELFRETSKECTMIVLEPGLKLKQVGWKDDSLWYLTREMRDYEKAESYSFQQNSNSETVTIVEQNLEDCGWE